MKNEAITFWQFLTNNIIEIPILQRDYAQGRPGKEELRKSFLKDIKSALDSSQRLKLDFVYGMKEHGVLNPLDGQQRLTTLWLLHWFIAYKARALDADTSSVFGHFTYETRISSRKFCKRLAEFTDLPHDEGGIVKHIANQTWFRHGWRHDPTIQAMLRMLEGELPDGLDGIAGVFDCACDYKAYWNKLTSSNCPIVFYHLELHNLKQTDDLYVKMNARGKPLTSFENFKADLVGYIENKNKEHSSEKGWAELANPSSGLAIKMDTDWANDVFWQNRSANGTVDEIFFAFLNRFFFSELCVASIDKQFVVSDRSENTNTSYNYFNTDSEIAYEGLTPYKFIGTDIPLESVRKLTVILDKYKWVSDALKKIGKDIKKLMACPWNSRNTDFCFIPEYDESAEGIMRDKAGNKIKKIRSVNQVQRVVFFAVCKFFSDLDKDWSSSLSKAMVSDTANGEEDFSKSIAEAIAERVSRWMRVVWNLVSCETSDGNPSIRSFDVMRRVMLFIDGLDSQNIYKCLIDLQLKDAPSSDDIFRLQLKEEVDKARQILSGNGQCGGEGKDEFQGQSWEEIIAEAERIAFFKGAIRFLFTNGKGEIDWLNFARKLKNAKLYFDQDGVAEEYRKDARLLRALLERVDKISDDFWFGNGAAFWRNKLLLNKNYLPVVSSLLETLLPVENAVSSKTIPEWIRDKTLLSDAISKDGDLNGEWHVFSSWKKQMTLTRYQKRRSDATVSRQIIPLDHFRNDLLAGMDSEQRRGTKYFIGLTADIDFTYAGYTFRWHRISDHSEDGFAVCLMKNAETGLEYAKCSREAENCHNDEKCLGFLVNIQENRDNFLKKLDVLIHNYTNM